MEQVSRQKVYLRSEGLKVVENYLESGFIVKNS
jgi:hypothetical protein